MIVVSDTSPLNYLILLDQIEFLPRLFGRVIVPSAVLTEMRDRNAPQRVQAWAANPPSWVDLPPAIHLDATLNQALGPGEREAISLALQIGADFVLVDELLGRLEAKRRNLKVTGTLGLLLEIALIEKYDLAQILRQLRAFGFYLSIDLERLALAQFTARLLK